MEYQVYKYNNYTCAQLDSKGGGHEVGIYDTESQANNVCLNLGQTDSNGHYAVNKLKTNTDDYGNILDGEEML